ncbi:hypothetical protein OAL54_07090 [Gammaproteobacteria bacterium]|nr:hypothetical protein [Gammaproteobacteria bacterium]
MLKLAIQQASSLPRPFFALVVTTILLVFPSLAAGSESRVIEAADSSEWGWNMIIAVIVIAISSASAALPIAASKQWTGSWRVSAIMPLAVLLLWIAIIVFGRLQSSDSHQLWPFEIFAWAMLNMIYMVAVMTVKRVLDKADQEKSLTD